MRTIKLTIAYDGTAYAGWQVQPDTPTIQGTLETALRQITGERLRVVASGRTDAGVHALGQVVSFDTAARLPAEAFRRALNASLPDDIVVLAAEEAPPGFHALRDARRKRYRYVLDDGPQPDVFRRRYAWHVHWTLNAEAVHRAGQALVGQHDFASFQTSGSPRDSTLRHVYELAVRRQPPPQAHLVHVEVEANGFLYNMVRAIVGTLVEVGRGARDERWPAQALAERDRRAAGRTAPPQGLLLVSVAYDSDSSGSPADCRGPGVQG